MKRLSKNIVQRLRERAARLIKRGKKGHHRAQYFQPRGLNR